MMNTPICDFVKKYNEQNSVRLHVPGHKGSGILGFEALDITEISGADVLYDAKGIINESQENASDIFGTAKTLYSTEGSSLCIRAMLYLAKLYAVENGKEPVILATRNAHKTFISAAAIMNVEVEWLNSKTGNLISCEIDLKELEEALKEKIYTALYLTSPDYLGYMCDIESISSICKKYNVLLIVDNAHGAYLKFLPKSIHPIDLGADICCDSAHKTLSVLTGGAYLHISKAAPKMLLENAQKALSLFASTSPSYLILQSLDMENKDLSDSFSKKLERTVKNTANLKNSLLKSGYTLFKSEPLKLTVSSKSYGYTGTELAEILEKKNIYCEFSDPDFVVMMFTPQITDEEFKYIENAFSDIERLAPIEEKPPALNGFERIISPHEAINSPSEIISVENAEGRILASISVNCPPAIPIVICGERIDSQAIKMFKYYGIEKCEVTKSTLS